MFGWTPRPVTLDPLWFLFHADVVIEGQFLGLMAICLLLWRHRRPRESGLLLQAISFCGLSYVPPVIVEWVFSATAQSTAAVKSFIFTMRPYLAGTSMLLATALQALVWWCLLKAAFDDSTPRIATEKQ